MSEFIYKSQIFLKKIIIFLQIFYIKVSTPNNLLSHARIFLPSQLINQVAACLARTSILHMCQFFRSSRIENYNNFLYSHKAVMRSFFPSRHQFQFFVANFLCRECVAS
jgi:hypothetical protein